MKVLITGINGQLGKELLQNQSPEFEKFGLDKNQFNLLDHEQCLKKIKDIKPDWIINAAAFTEVDNSEIQIKKAFAINSDAVQMLAKTVSDYGGKLLHISTDFVFDGLKKKPYLPTDICRPINIYGSSKLKGEYLSLKFPGTIVVRTSWLYGHSGKNFCLKMIELQEKSLKQGKPIYVVNDQLGSPTNVIDLSKLCWEIIKNNFSFKSNLKIFHWSNRGIISWYDFAKSIGKLAKEYGLIHEQALIQPITSSEYKTLAKRPMFSALDCQDTVKHFKINQIDWEESLKISLKIIANQGKN